MKCRHCGCPLGEGAVVYMGHEAPNDCLAYMRDRLDRVEKALDGMSLSAYRGLQPPKEEP